MKRTQIGNITIDTNKYLFDLNKPIEEMRQNQVRIISHLDLLQEKANFTDNEVVLNDLYNQMDLYFCIYCLIEQFAENTTYLEMANFYFIDAINKGRFDTNFKTLSDRNSALNNTIQEISTAIVSNYALDTTTVEDELMWWKENVMDLNFFEQNGKRNEFYVKDVTINGTREEFLTDFKKSGVAWSYLRCDVSLIKDNKKAVVKLAQQKSMQAYLSRCNLQLDSVTQNNLIDSGILAQTGGKNANDCVYSLRQQAQKSKTPKVGEPIALITAILTILGTCVGIACKVINQVKSMRTDNEARQLDPQYLVSEDDWLGFLDSDKDGQIDMKWIFLLGGILAVGAYIFK